MKKIIRYVKTANALIGLLIQVDTTSTVAQISRPKDGQIEVFSTLGPGIPRLRFHNGAVRDNQAEISPDLPNIPGPPSPWYVAQWGQQQLMVPNEMTRNDPVTWDPRLGLALYGFNAPDRHSHVWIYQSGDYPEPVLELYEKNGELRAGGGANIFLSTNTASQGASLDKRVEYELTARIARADVKYATATAETSGAVLAGVFTGFIIHFPDPDSAKLATLFLQIAHSSSRGLDSGDYRSCDASNGTRTIIYSSALRDDQRLAFKSDTGPLVHLTYLINRYVCDLINHPLTCKDKNKSFSDPPLSLKLNDFRDWKIYSIYIGLETQAEDLRPQSQNLDLQGSVSVALQLTGLHVRQYSEQTFTPRDCATFQ